MGVPVAMVAAWIGVVERLAALWGRFRDRRRGGGEWPPATRPRPPRLPLDGPRIVLLLALVPVVAGCASRGGAPSLGEIQELCEALSPCEPCPRCPDATAPPPPAPAPPPAVEPEHIFGGAPVVREINISGGWVEFDAWVHESGRGDDWAKAALLEVYDGAARDGAGNYFSLLPYKAKACRDRSCREPRYNLPWDRWRKVRCEWTPTRWNCAVDGMQVVATLSGPWGVPVMAAFGGPPMLAGARVRGVRWSQ